MARLSCYHVSVVGRGGRDTLFSDESFKVRYAQLLQEVDGDASQLIVEEEPLTDCFLALFDDNAED